MSMQTTDPTNSLWIAKLIGALAGSAISIAYVLPHGRREAAIRFAAGVAGGLVLGSTVGAYIANELQINTILNAFETVLMGSSIASLFLWWAIGLVQRASDNKTNGTNSGAGKKPGGHP